MSNDLIDLGFTNKEVINKSMTEVAESRATADVQAGYVIAQKFPRNELERYSVIMESCKRPFFGRTGNVCVPSRGYISDRLASIRLAEAMAQAWKHIEFGLNEISQTNGISLAEAYAIDKQNGTTKRISFHVRHERHTKKGITKLTDPRDIYELVANQGARRVRACILAILPGDVVEAAVEQVKKTLQSSDVPISEQIKKMVIAFDELGVKVEHLEKRLGHNLDATIPAEIVTLKGIYKTLKDGMADRSDYFEISSTKAIEAKEQIAELLEAKKKPIVNKNTGEVI